MLLYADDRTAAAPVDEAPLADLGVYRVPVPVPFMEAGGPVNLFAIEDEGGGHTFFDCGVGTAEGTRVLREACASLGVDLKKVNRIIVSHGHVDHYGNAQLLAEESGAPVFLHEADGEKVCGDGRWFKQLRVHVDYYLRHGVPQAVLDEMIRTSGSSGEYARQVEPRRVQPLVDGQRFRFKHFEAQVLHMPGHTPGLMCLWAPEQRIFFANDHILARVSPNPLIDLTTMDGDDKRFRSLATYLVSARRAHALDIAMVLPGHGEAFQNHRPLLDGLFSFYARRQERMLKHLRKVPSASLHELVHQVFPRVDVRRMYLMVSEVLGNVEVMEDDGRVVRTLEDGVWRYRATG